VSLGVLAPLKVSDYRKLWVGQIVSVVGDKLNQIAMGIMVYKVTGSMLQMGIMLGITVLPSALFGLIAGAYVDRWDRRRTMIVSDLLRGALVLLIPWAIANGGVLSAYLLAFSVATVALFFEPAKLSLIPELVPDAELMAANSLDNASSAIAELVGLAFAGAVVGILGYARAFQLDAVSYVFSAGMIALISHRESRRGAAPIAVEAMLALDPDANPLPELIAARDVSPDADPAAGIFAEVAQGARHIWRTPLLRDLTTLWAFAALGLGASLTLGYGLALQRYDAGALGLALLDGSIAIGILVGTLTVGRTNSAHSGVSVLGGLTVFGLSFGLVAAAPTIWVAAPLLLLGGIANMWFLIPTITMVQRTTREELRGRVLAARQTITRIASAISIVLAGLAVEQLSMSSVILAVSAMVLAAAAWGWTRPSLRDA
jgi:DHA3 family macrolide efflux protein-like MFS transporter